MNHKTDEEQLSADLAALGAVAHGAPKTSPLTAVPDPAREAKIAEIKAQYEAGRLTIDAEAIATKLVDAHFKTDKLG